MKSTTDATQCPRSVEGSTGKKSPRILLLFFVCVLALLFSPALRAQATGSFSGNVTDKSGSAVPGVTVVVTSPATGLSRDTKADSAGHYLIPLLPVGTYTVSVKSSGFADASFSNIVVRVTETTRLIATLTPGARALPDGTVVYQAAE